MSCGNDKEKAVLITILTYRQRHFEQLVSVFCKRNSLMISIVRGSRLHLLSETGNQEKYAVTWKKSHMSLGDHRRPTNHANMAVMTMMFPC